MTRLLDALTRVLRRPRCTARGQLMSGHSDLPLVCDRRRGHRGRHKDGLTAWSGDARPTSRAGGPS